MNELATNAMFKEEAERVARQERAANLFPSDFDTLPETQRLRVVSQLYQENPGLRAELLTTIEQRLRGRDMGKAVSPDEMLTNISRAKIDDMYKRTQEIEREYKYIQKKQADADRRLRDLQTTTSPASASDYNKWPMGLVELEQYGPGFSDSKKRGPSASDASVGGVFWDGPSGEEQKVIYSAPADGRLARRYYDGPSGGALAPAVTPKTPAKPAVPMAPQPGRRKIRLDD